MLARIGLTPGGQHLEDGIHLLTWEWFSACGLPYLFIYQLRDVLAITPPNRLKQWTPAVGSFLV
ncbi:MAG TPA: hypothetical protein VFO63_04500 [Blastocatellia bacterium]|nr:hypothetical protein [Blastocatellia bacterium]